MGLRDEGLRESLPAQGLKQGGLRGSLRNLNSTGPDIPDSVVSRPKDDNSFTISSGTKRGVQIQTDVEWPEIGARLSDNTASDVTTAYVYRVSDGNLMGSADISALTGGDSFTIDLNTPLTSGDTYNFVVDAGGSSYTFGFLNGGSYPYISSDGDLSIVDGAAGTTGTDSNVNALNDIGNTGF